MTEELSEKKKQFELLLEAIGPVELMEIEEKDFRAYLKKRKEEE